MFFSQWRHDDEISRDSDAMDSWSYWLSTKDYSKTDAQLRMMQPVEKIYGHVHRVSYEVPVSEDMTLLFFSFCNVSIGFHGQTWTGCNEETNIIAAITGSDLANFSPSPIA